jgi:hypothetical protein
MPDPSQIQIGAGNGRKLLQIIPINIITIIVTIGSAAGLYWKFDERISKLENAAGSGELTDRVKSLETKFDAQAPMIIRTDTNVQWLMDKQSPTAPKGGHP